MEQLPLVSVRLMVYNNELFIREAIESVLMQETDFKVEVVVGDDFSTDNTLNIIKSYESTKNIEIKILDRPIGGEYWRKRNSKNASVRTNFFDILEHCRGRYIALLDGDDYWTDPLKLQKQVDFLEANPDYAICFHRANLLRDNNSISLHPIPEISKTDDFEYIDLLIHHNFIATASVLFRKPDNLVFSKWFFKIPFGDLGLYKIVSGNRKIKCLDEAMSVYRIHDRGIYSKLTKIQKSKQYLAFYKEIFALLTKEEGAVVKCKRAQQLKTASKLKYPNSKWMRLGYMKYLEMKYPLQD